MADRFLFEVELRAMRVSMRALSWTCTWWGRRLRDVTGCETGATLRLKAYGRGLSELADP